MTAYQRKMSLLAVAGVFIVGFVSVWINETSTENTIVVRFASTVTELEAREILNAEKVVLEKLVFTLPSHATEDCKICGIDFGFVNESKTYELTTSDLEKFGRLLRKEEAQRNICNDQCRIHFGFTHESEFDPPNFEQLFNKIKILPYLEFIYQPRHDQDSSWISGASVDWLSVYTRAKYTRPGFLLIPVRFSQKSFDEFIGALKSDAPEWTVLPKELLDPRNNGDFVYSEARPNEAFITIGRKAEIEQLRKLSTEEPEIVSGIGIQSAYSEPWTVLPYAHHNIFKIRFQENPTQNPIGFVERKYNLLKAYPRPTDEAYIKENGSYDPTALIQTEATGVVPDNTAQEVLARLKANGKVLLAHKFHRDSLPTEVSDPRGVMKDGNILFASGELLVNMSDDPNAEEYVRDIAEKTNGKIIGQVEGLGIYQIYYSEIKDTDDLDKLSDAIEKMPGVQSVSKNLLSGPL